MRHPQFEAVRARFQYKCAYCGVTETATGGELTIDHYRPRVAGGNDELPNLIYACIRCNLYKGEFWPDANDLANDRRVLHPLFDDVSHHLVESEQTGELQGSTPAGDFHIALLHLNRSQLVAHRVAQRLQAVLMEKIHLLEQQNVQLGQTISAQERYLAYLLRAASLRDRLQDDAE